MPRLTRTLIALALACGSCDGDPPRLEQEGSSATPMVSDEQAPDEPAQAAPKPAGPPPPRPASLGVPDRCDRLMVQDTPSGPRLTKERPMWIRKGPTRWARQLKLRALIRVVVLEMGGDELAAEMVWRKAIVESSGNAGAIHILSKDVEANRAGAAKGRRYASKRWRRATVPVYARRRGRLREVGKYDAWALGRGLYGMVSGLHMRRWSADAPPWSLCDPVIATVTLVWAMRAGLEDCHGSTLRDAYRRFSSGKCAIREDKLERRFDRLARGKVRGLRLEAFDPDAPAVLGDRWPEKTTDRAELLARMRALVGSPVEPVHTRN